MKYLLVLAVLFLSGCPQQSSPGTQPQPEYSRPAPSYMEHTIVYSGETLAEIALHYTGRSTNWLAIQDANPGIRPERLRIGQTILIPRDLVVNDKPFVKTVSKKSIDAMPVEQAAEELTTEEEKKAPSTESSPSPTPVATAEPTPAPTAEPTPIPTAEPTVAPVTTGAASSSSDNERERLLDELLQ